MSGIYIHIPFCKQKCSYCDFYFSTTFQSYRGLMIETLRNEIRLRSNYLHSKNIQSIYFGGGTPSLLTEEELGNLLQEIQIHFILNEGIEITLEANPDDINITKLLEWKRTGINRLSIGLQSFKENDLRWMNRAHTAEESLNCILLAKQNGFDNISVDLMYGLPGLSTKDWEKHIQTVIEFRVQHISAYCLTIEENTKLHKMVKQKRILPLNEDEQADQFLILVDRLKSSGFEHYEISNFGLPGFEAIHNSNYWKGTTYLGIGPSAHSFNGVSRRWNMANNQLYIKSMGNSENWYEEEILSVKDQWNELVLTCLRTSFGVNLETLKKIHDLTDNFLMKLNELESKQWLIVENNRILLLPEGLLKADFIASELFL